mgnify:CR=1 FL=1
MSLYRALRPLLFNLNAETAHNLAMWAISNGFVAGRVASPKPVSAFGIEFPNPIGLAAGFDKNAVAIDQWRKLGFGFIEVGTITRHPQPGNPKPRLFRLPEDEAIINRMGFNNEGVDAIAERIERSEAGIPLGINMGKSKITPLEEAVEDYAYSFERLKGLGDYYVVNVSSPNTPGLRELQDKDELAKILIRLKEIDSEVPLFVKIAPELTKEAVEEVVTVATECELTGIVCNNTSIGRDGLTNDPSETGGLSGKPILEKSNETLRFVCESAGDLTIIGVGGITDAASAQSKFEIGAKLIQVYSGWIYGGPEFVPDLVDALP